MSKWDDFGGISEVFWTTDGRYSFQRVSNVWRLYSGQEGFFIKQFPSFAAMQIYIYHLRHDMKGE